MTNIVNERDVVIVGSGPAGCATALALHRYDPSLTRNVLVLEALRHPREKVCAGGINGRAWGLLEQLGVNVDVPHVEINGVFVKTARGEIWQESPGITRVVLRDEFDAAVAAHLVRQGIELREDTRVLALKREGNRIVIETTAGVFRSYAVVGADGVASVVRRNLFDSVDDTYLMAIASCPAKGHFTHEQKAVYLDFSLAAHGARGYRWIFPFLRDSEEWINTGICEWRHRSASELKEDLARYLKSNDMDPARAIFRFFPVRPFHPRNPFCAPGVILAGEAAGIDPFFGEGVSYAIEYGMLAADSIAEALRRRDFSFQGHMKALKWSRVGKELMMSLAAAKLFYGGLHRTFAKALHSDDRFLYLLTEVLSGRLEPSTMLAIKMLVRIASALVK